MFSSNLLSVYSPACCTHGKSGNTKTTPVTSLVGDVVNTVLLLVLIGPSVKFNLILTYHIRSNQYTLLYTVISLKCQTFWWLLKFGTEGLSVPFFSEFFPLRPYCIPPWTLKTLIFLVGIPNPK